MLDALYEPDGDRLMPTSLTVGPWSPEAQHGGPVAALLAQSVETLPADSEMRCLRITVELLRPIPLRPLTLRAEVARPGRKVQLLEATLHDGDTEVARARALRLRVTPVAVPGPEPEALPALPETAPAPSGPLGPFGYAGAVELRFAAGSWAEEGPATVWGRLLVPVVAGTELTPLASVAAIADFGNGVSRVVPFGTHRFINPDLTVALSRPPRGGWVGFDMVTRLSQEGSGQAESRVMDREGTIGRSVQTLLVEAGGS